MARGIKPKPSKKPLGKQPIISMENEIAALRKKHAAGKLTNFKLRQGIKKIKEKYEKKYELTNLYPKLDKKPKDKPVSSVTTVISLVPAATNIKRSGEQLKSRKVSKGSGTTVSDEQKKTQTSKKKKPLLPKSPPKRLKKNLPTSKTTKKSENKKPKLYTTIDPRTGKLLPESAKKVSFKRHLANIDAFKARVDADKKRKSGKFSDKPGILTEAQAKSGTITADKLTAWINKNKKKRG